MKKLKLTNSEISELCLSLRRLLHADIPTGDALLLLADSAEDRSVARLLRRMAHEADQGSAPEVVFRGAGCFPPFVSTLLEVGSRTGRMEEALGAISDYYTFRDRLDSSLHSAIVYPSVLMLVMSAVMVALLVYVLPVFDQVYAQMGSGLTGLAAGLLTLGVFLRRIMPLVVFLLSCAVLFLFLFSSSAAFREEVMNRQRRRGKSGLFTRMTTALFAKALSMGLESGLTVEDAVRLGGKLLEGHPEREKSLAACLSRLQQGESPAVALGDTGLLPQQEAHILDVGFRSGSPEDSAVQIAERLAETAERSIDEGLNRLEPAMVLGATMMVGIILLTVMLPLINIMSAIG